MMEEITTGQRSPSAVHDTIGNLLKTNLTPGCRVSLSAAFEKISLGQLVRKASVQDARSETQSLMGRSGAVGMLSVPFMNDHNRMGKDPRGGQNHGSPRPSLGHWIVYNKV